MSLFMVRMLYEEMMDFPLRGGGWGGAAGTGAPLVTSPPVASKMVGACTFGKGVNLAVNRLCFGKLSKTPHSGWFTSKQTEKTVS